MDQAWKDHFKPWILDRGREYHRQGNVLRLTHTGNEIHALVDGSERYEVTIRFSRGIPKKASCSCPYATGGQACKHMAAVLFALEELDYVLEDDPETPDWTEALAKLPADVLRVLVRNLAEDAPGLQELLVNLYEALEERQDTQFHS